MTQQAHLSDAFPLANGVAIPCLGYGTWRMQDGAETVAAIQTALSLGYRHIDTAAYYRNEASVGQALRASGPAPGGGLPHQQGFGTPTGLCPNQGRLPGHPGPPGHRLPGPLPHPHWPAAANQFDDWEAINRGHLAGHDRALPAGKIRAIGVSNFRPHHLKALLETEVAPMVNQIEFHPGCQQRETLAFCRDHGILVEAWSPWAGAGCWTTPSSPPSPKTTARRRPKSACGGAWNRGSSPAQVGDPRPDGGERGPLHLCPHPGGYGADRRPAPFGGSGHDPDQLDF